MCHASNSKGFWSREHMRITLEMRSCMIRIIWPPPSWFARSIGPAQRYSFDYRYFVGSVITIGLSTNGFSQRKRHFDERKQDWLGQQFGLRRLQRLDAIRAELPFSPSQSTWRDEEALLEEFYPGGRGNSQWWPIRGGSAQKRYIFRLQVYERVGISLVEVYKRVGKSGCHLGLWEAPKGVTDRFYGFIKLRKRSVFVIDSYLKDSALRAFKTDAKF